DGVERLSLKEIHFNKTPMVLPPSMLDDSTAQRLAIDKLKCEQHWQTFRHLSVSERQALQQKLYQLYSTQEFAEKTDPEQMLYSGFFDEQDKRLMVQVRQATPELLSSEPFAFRDPRLKEMLFRYRARNFPTSLSLEEQQRWQVFCRMRFTVREAQASLTLDEFDERLQRLIADADTTESQKDLLKQLTLYADKLRQRL
ncbi:MAG TPA: exodeoxyribonuclease I, partial [Cellvibrio sp.]|nr:exodeoxyribonuclease I [Cellvibrio sp.]